MLLPCAISFPGVFPNFEKFSVSSIISSTIWKIKPKRLPNSIANLISCWFFWANINGALQQKLNREDAGNNVQMANLDFVEDEGYDVDDKDYDNDDKDCDVDDDVCDK